MQAVVVYYDGKWWYRNAGDKGAERYGPFTSAQKAKDYAVLVGHSVENIRT